MFDMVTSVKCFECEWCKQLYSTETALAKHEKVCLHRERKDWQGTIIRNRCTVEVVGGPCIVKGEKGYSSIFAEDRGLNSCSIAFLESEGDYDPQYCILPGAEELSRDELETFLDELKVSFASAVDNVIASVSHEEGEQ